MAVACIYKILNIKNGKFYIGSTNDFYRRRSQHKSDLQNNKHSNQYLQNAWNKYGQDSFTIKIIEKIKNIDEQLQKEQSWIDKTQCFNPDIGYNISPTVTNIIIADSTKEKLSKASSGVNNHFSKLTEIEVLQVLDLLNYGFNCMDISKMTDINYRTINDIKRGKTWSHLTGVQYFKSREKQRISEDTAIKIYKLLKQNFKHKEIAKIFDVPIHIVSDISRGNTWNSITSQV